LRPRGHGSMLA